MRRSIIPIPQNITSQRFTFFEEKLVGKLALQAFQALKAKGWGRVDFMRDEEGQFYALEVNTVPGMTEKSLVPMAAKQAGMSFQALCLAILNQFCRLILQANGALRG